MSETSPPGSGARDVRVPVARTVEDVDAFVRDVRRLPEWAPGFAADVRRHDGGGWSVVHPGR